ADDITHVGLLFWGEPLALVSASVFPCHALLPFKQRRQLEFILETTGVYEGQLHPDIKLWIFKREQDDVMALQREVVEQCECQSGLSISGRPGYQQGLAEFEVPLIIHPTKASIDNGTRRPLVQRLHDGISVLVPQAISRLEIAHQL